MTEIVLFFLFCTKHFIVDFPLQRPYQYLNKGTYGHPGGILHAYLHTFSTFGILTIYGLVTENEIVSAGAVFIAIIEGIIHYHIDWAKMNINKIAGWTCDRNDEFWYLMGFDQYLHYLTYIAIIWWIASN